MFVCLFLWRVHQSNQNCGVVLLSLRFPRFVTTLNTKVKKKETAANFFNHLRKNKEQHTHFIHSYKKANGANKRIVVVLTSSIERVYI